MPVAPATASRRARGRARPAATRRPCLVCGAASPAWASQSGSTEPERSAVPRPAQPGAAIARARQRPAHRVGRAHAGRVRPAAPRQRRPRAPGSPWSASKTASSTSTSTPAARSNCSSAPTSERSRRAAAVRPSGELVLAEGDHVLGEREPRDERPQPRDRARASLEPGEAGDRRRVAGNTGERLLEGAARARAVPGSAQEFAEQLLDVGDVLGRRAAGGDREAHRALGAARGRRAARADTTPARSRKFGFASIIACSSRCGLGVAAELDQRVDAHRRAVRSRAGARARAPA